LPVRFLAAALSSNKLRRVTRIHFASAGRNGLVVA